MSAVAILDYMLPVLLPLQDDGEWVWDDDGMLVGEAVPREVKYRVNVEEVGCKVIVSRCADGVGSRGGDGGDELVTVLTEDEMRARQRADRANVKRSCKRAYQRVLDLCEGIRGDRMLTLTFQECVVDLDVALLAWGVFVPLLYAAVGRIDYVCVPERQKRGAVHFHVVLNSYVDWRVILTAWRKAVSTVSSKTGGIDIRSKRVRQHAGEGYVEALARYIAKYVGKAFYMVGGAWGVGRKRYYSNVAIKKSSAEVSDEVDSKFINGEIRNKYNEIVGECDYLAIFEKLFGKKFKRVVKKWSFCSVFNGFCYRIEGVLA